MSHDYEAMRDAMVESQLRTNAVSDARVIKAMAEVPRERFVPEDKAALAYAEMLVPLSASRRLNLPMATARLLTELALRKDDHILVIGSATGYAAAVCSHLAEKVVALEEDATLAAIAQKQLADAPNVELVAGPLRDGWVAAAPYDAILIDGVIEDLPAAIPDQLANGGRLAAAISEAGISRLSFGRKHGSAFGMVAFADTESARLPGFERSKEFAF